MPALSDAQPLQDVEHGVDSAARGRERRSILLPEPQLYRGAQLVISDSRGNQYIAERCPIALADPDSSACHIVRRGFITKHGVVSLGFPVYLSRVQQLECQTHRRHFHMLHPLIHEALPASCTVQPELVVLTEKPCGAPRGLRKPGGLGVCSTAASVVCWTSQPHPMGINDACTMHVIWLIVPILAGAGQQQHAGRSNKAPAAVSVSLGVLPTQMGSLGKTESGPRRVGSCPAYGPHMGSSG